MLGKVEICGVNTAELKVLSSDACRALLIRAKHGDRDAREQLIAGNLRLVLSVIQKFTGRGESADDLFQVGCIGLIKAIDNFDAENHDVRFSTYGVPMISGEIRRYLRDNSPIRVSRSTRDTAYQVLQEKERLTAATGREPSLDEIAKSLGLPRQTVVFALDAISDPISLYEPIYTDSGESICVMDQVGDTKIPTSSGSSGWRSRARWARSMRARKRSSLCAFTPERHRWRSPVRSASVRHRCRGLKSRLLARSAVASSPHKLRCRAIDCYENAAEVSP